MTETADAGSLPQTFAASADAALARVRAIYAERADQHHDAWALPNLRTTLTDQVLNLPRVSRDDREWLRLLQLAVLCDIKDARIAAGSTSLDSLHDGIAYRAAYVALLHDYLDATP